MVEITTDPAFRARLAAFGLLPGAEVEVVRVAPLGDPLELRLGRTRLALRRADARRVVVEVAPP